MLPWQLANWPQLQPVEPATQIVPGQGSAILCGLDEDMGLLKDFGHRVQLGKDVHCLVELPGPAVRGPEMEALHIGRDGETRIKFLPNSLPKWRHGPEMVLEHGHLEYDGFIDDALARMQEVEDFVAALAKSDSSHHAWWPSLLSEFIGYLDSDEAGRGLIVKIAEKMPLYLRDIASGPKRVLRRFREGSRLDRIQELDVHCLLDYAQRPGRTAVEKAGQKQRLLSVIRQESFDTIENRVILDFCRRSMQAVKSYRDQNRTVKPFDPVDRPNGSKRLARVANYGKYCDAYVRDPLWEGVVALTEPCRTPNYALAQNPLYVEVWREYLKLLRYANLRETVWRWPRRAWADIVRILVGEGVRKMFEGADSVRLARKPVQFGPTIERGSWYRHGTSDGDWLVRREGRDLGCLYVVDRYDIGHFSRSDELALANADCYLAWLPHGSQGAFYLPIWAMVGDLRWKDASFAAQTRNEWVSDLARSLELLKVRLPGDCRLAGGLVIRGDWMGEKPGKTEMVLRPSANAATPVWFLETHAYGSWGNQTGQLHQIVERLIHNDSGH